MYKNAKISIISFIISAGILMLAVITAIYINDPLQVWHKSYKNSNTMSYTIRESAKAFIRDYDFDSVIIGNSHTENTSAKMAGDVLDGKFFNLSMSGSSIYDKFVILRYLFKNKKIKQVVYLVDNHHFTNFEKDFANFGYLYNENPYDDIKIYLNNKYFGCSLGIVPKTKCVRKIKNIDRPYTWEQKKYHTKRFGGFDIWLKYKTNKQIAENFDIVLKTPLKINNEELTDKYKLGLDDYFQNYLYSVIEQHPDTKFYIIVSPVSELALANMLRDKNLSYKKYQYTLSNLVKASEKYPNLEVYAFDDDNSIGKMEDYKDFTHYRPWVNEFIIKSIASKKHLITKANLNEYNSKLYNKATGIDYKYYVTKIKQALSK